MNITAIRREQNAFFKELMLQWVKELLTIYLAIIGIISLIVLIYGEISIHNLEEKYPQVDLPLYQEPQLSIREMFNNYIDSLEVPEELLVREQARVVEEKEQVESLNIEKELPYGINVDGITPEVGTFNISSYCPCEKCCNKTDGITASGKKATEWCTIAAGKKYELGTIIYIPDLADMPNEGWFIVEDRGGAISDEKLDVYMSTHEKALEFGRKYLECYVYEKEE